MYVPRDYIFCESVLTFHMKTPGKPEITDSQITISIYQNIRRFQISVQNIRTMNVFQWS